MTDPSTERVFWLTGVAGTGKTTVARSVASMAEERRCLGGSFFFSRTQDVAGRGKAAGVIATIAYQLARTYPVLRERVCSAISVNHDVRSRSLPVQAKTLLSDAFRGLAEVFPSPLLIVVDALDECEKDRSGREGGDLLPILLRCMENLPFRVKVFVTSRPEPSITTMFGQADIHASTRDLALHHDIEQDVVQSDIEHYLRHEFDNIANERGLALPFPSTSNFQILLGRAGTLFIYARTVIEYIAVGHADAPADRVADLVNVEPDSTSQQFAGLDILYTQILTGACGGRSASELQRVRDVVGSIVVLQENVSVSTLSTLADVKERWCKNTLQALSSLLLYKHQPDELIKLMHPSFPDFATNVVRCKDSNLVIHASAHHLRLADRCLHLLNHHLQANICGLTDPSLSNAQLVDLGERLDRVAPFELRYACRYWAVHLREYMDSPGERTELPHSLDIFVSTHLLHWLELASLLGLLSDIKRGLSLLLASSQVNTKYQCI
jgi:hypothetical protein